MNGSAAGDRDERLDEHSVARAVMAREGVSEYSAISARVADKPPLWMVRRRHVSDGHPLLFRLPYSERRNV